MLGCNSLSCRPFEKGFVFTSPPPTSSSTTRTEELRPFLYIARVQIRIVHRLMASAILLPECLSECVGCLVCSF